jgi:hypothetical protein
MKCYCGKPEAQYIYYLSDLIKREDRTRLIPPIPFCGLHLTTFQMFAGRVVKIDLV